jgi:hypothetical protein
MTTKSTSSRHLFSRVVPLTLLLMASANLYAQQPISRYLDGQHRRAAGSHYGKRNRPIHHNTRPQDRDRQHQGTFGLVPTMAHIHEAAIGKNGPVNHYFGKNCR